MKTEQIIYVMCPAYHASGGTELLHQLVYKCKTLFDVNAIIFYQDIDKNKGDSPTPSRFLKYTQGRWVAEIIDSERNILIIPETYAIRHKPYNKVRKVLWWLSVDNFFGKIGINYSEQYNKKSIKVWLRKLFKVAPYDIVSEIIDENLFTKHLVQSEYANQMLIKHGIKNIAFLSDFINPETYASSSIQRKKDQVVYNPLKGASFTQRLIASAPEISWIPISNMSPVEVSATLAESKVYIDFGNHPGKDRIPREAAMNQCLIYTNRSGSAAFTEDVDIPYNFKFSIPGTSFSMIIDRIKSGLMDYNLYINSFEGYRRKIAAEEQHFEQELACLMVEWNKA